MTLTVYTEDHIRIVELSDRFAKNKSRLMLFTDAKKLAKDLEPDMKSYWFEE